MTSLLVTGFLSSKINSSQSGLVIIIGLVVCLSDHILYDIIIFSSRQATANFSS